MANILQIEVSEIFGRHIISKCDVPVGKTVLIEKAFAARNIGSPYEKCTICLKADMNFIACTGCIGALYCDNVCASGKNPHTMECNDNLYDTHRHSEYYMRSIMIAINIFPNIESLMKFVEDAIKNKKPQIPGPLLDIKSRYRALLQLSMYLPRERNEKFLKDACQLYDCLLLRKSIKRLFNTELKKRFLMHLVLHHGCAISQNHFLTEDRMCAFILSSYFNHSCAPNLMTYSIANQRIFITTRPIKAGEQMYVSYLLDLFSSDHERKQLFDNFGFECNCERCEPDEEEQTLASNYLQADSDYQHFIRESQQLVSRCVHSETNKKLEILKERYIIALNRFGDVHWCDELAKVIENFESFYEPRDTQNNTNFKLLFEFISYFFLFCAIIFYYFS